MVILPSNSHFHLENTSLPMNLSRAFRHLLEFPVGHVLLKASHQGHGILEWRIWIWLWLYGW